MAEALERDKGPRNIRSGLFLISLFEYFQLWDTLQKVALITEEDQHSWRLDGSGVFSSKSSYRAFYNGLTTFEPWRRVWKSWAPPKCKVFLWLAIGIEFGPRIGLLRDAFPTRANALFVIRRTRRCNICWPHVSSPVNFGSESYHRSAYLTLHRGDQRDLSQSGGARRSSEH